MHLPFRLAAGFSQGGEKAFMISVVPENVLPLVATVQPVIQGTRILNAQFAGHSRTLSDPAKSVNSDD